MEFKLIKTKKATAKQKAKIKRLDTYGCFYVIPGDPDRLIVRHWPNSKPNRVGRIYEFIDDDDNSYGFWEAIGNVIEDSICLETFTAQIPGIKLKL